MIALFSIFQFSFLYIPILFIGMAVYGTDIKSESGYIYIATILIISTLLGLLKYKRYPKLLTHFNSVFALCGGIASIFLYKYLHMNYWDEHSIMQAALIAVVGLASCVVSINTSLANQRQSHYSEKIFFIFSLLSIIALLSIYYPMISFLFIGLSLIASAIFSYKLIPSTQTAPIRFSRYFIFIIFLDLPLVIWDFQVNTQWGAYIAASYFACCLGLLLPAKQNIMTACVAIFLFNFAFCAIDAEYVLNPLHSMITGLCLGIYLNLHINTQKFSLNIIPAMAAPATLGFIISLLFYSNLYYASWRLLFLVPPLLFFMYQFIQGRSIKVN